VICILAGRELPVGFGMILVSICLPRGDFIDQALLIGNAPIETLAG
jgi:hypothetical protein